MKDGINFDLNSPSTEGEFISIFKKSFCDAEKKKAKIQQNRIFVTSQINGGFCLQNNRR